MPPRQLYHSNKPWGSEAPGSTGGFSGDGRGNSLNQGGTTRFALCTRQPHSGLCGRAKCLVSDHYPILPQLAAAEPPFLWTQVDASRPTGMVVQSFCQTSPRGLRWQDAGSCRQHRAPEGQATETRKPVLWRRALWRESLPSTQGCSPPLSGHTPASRVTSHSTCRRLDICCMLQFLGRGACRIGRISRTRTEASPPQGACRPSSGEPRLRLPPRCCGRRAGVPPQSLVCDGAGRWGRYSRSSREAVDTHTRCRARAVTGHPTDFEASSPRRADLQPLQSDGVRSKHRINSSGEEEGDDELHTIRWWLFPGKMY
ncbi:uncharacterized protein [Manis javanica]|uniref:uncharacterized protein isoform X2 n=1 Tax=Manis javanica TaxID=9974 RepID=UPI003C6D0D26